MFVAHIAIGSLGGAAASMMAFAAGASVWATILCYSLGGSAFTLASALACCALSELVEKRLAPPQPDRYGRLSAEI